MLFVGAGRKGDHTLALEQVRHRTVGTEAAAVLAEGVPNFRHGAIAVVGHGFNQQRHAACGVALIGQLIEVGTLPAAGAPVDGLLDRVLGHIGAERLVHGGAQSRIVLQNTAPEPSGDGHFAQNLGPQLPPLGILSGLAVLDVGPLAVPGHRLSLAT